MKFPYWLIVGWIIVGFFWVRNNRINEEARHKSNLEQIWVCEQRYNTAYAKVNDVPICIADYSAAWDTCIYYLDFWEPIQQGDTIETVTLDFVTLYRIQ